MNLLNVTQRFSSEDEALDYLVAARWPKGVRCLACDCDKVYRIDTHGKTGKPCRLYECADCGLHFSATTNTLFHDSHLPLAKWFMAMALMAEAKKGISANQVARHIGVQYRTAWYLCHRIRKAMQEQGGMIGGSGKIVEVDETFIGGKKKRKGVFAGKQAKVAVLGIAERGGSIHLQTISNVKAESIRPVLEAKLNPETDKVVTDAHPVYDWTIPEEKHLRTVHKQELREFDGIVGTRTIETAFSLFKRGIVGSYHKMSRDHMDSYLGEFCWRFNRRHQQRDMFDMILHETTHNAPLPYKKLTREIF